MNWRACWAGSGKSGAMSISDLPALNAALNGVSALFLVAGYICIRNGRVEAHRNCMVGAVVTSTLFLISYLTYHYHAETLTRFVEPGWFRPIYLVILLTHTVLATVLLPMVLVTLYRAVRGQFEKHRKIARWTWPVWVYVSVTGVLIYLLLYQIFPQPR
jgi:putative membrane protein